MAPKRRFPFRQHSPLGSPVGPGGIHDKERVIVAYFTDRDRFIGRKTRRKVGNQRIFRQFEPHGGLK